MTTNIAILGGNGYLGRNLTALWQAKDPQANFWILSRSGQNQLTGANIHNQAVQLTDMVSVKAALPAHIDYFVDLIGRPEKDAQLSQQINDQPAQLMQTLAVDYQVRAMGFIGGKLGPKAFLKTKARLIKQLQTSSVPLAYVEPTLVYGAGRNDTMTKMVPLLKVLGTIIPNMRPVLVSTVVNDLYTQLQQLGARP